MLDIPHQKGDFVAPCKFSFRRNSILSGTSKPSSIFYTTLLTHKKLWKLGDDDDDGDDDEPFW
jgi:hypothetical protein